MPSIIASLPYNHAPEELRAEFAALLCRIWPETLPEKPLHAPELVAHSFYCRMDGKLAAYAAVLQKEIYHAGTQFRFAGLSCVATLPEYRGMGLGTQIVRAATEWMARQSALDFGIFTCQVALTTFYGRAGGWEVKPDLTLIGNAKPDALNSRTLKVAVLQRIFSEHAHRHAVHLEHGVISLDFPDGEFL